MKYCYFYYSEDIQNRDIMYFDVQICKSSALTSQFWRAETQSCKSSEPKVSSFSLSLAFERLTPFAYR